MDTSLSLPAAELRLTDSPSKDLEGETTGLFVSDFAGLCAGEAGADFTGEPGSSVAVSFSPENTENHLRIKVKQKRDGQRESTKKIPFFYLVLIAPACSYLLPILLLFLLHPGDANRRSQSHVLFPPSNISIDEILPLTRAARLQESFHP